MNTAALVGRALLLHVSWWLRGVLRWRDPAASMSPRRAFFLLLLMPLLIVVQAIHGCCLLLDEWLFPGYRKTALDGSLVITGVPRSGTTFLHRTLAVDRQRYITMSTWEAVLAPSIVQRRLIRALGWLDARFGGFGKRLVDAITHKLAGGLEDIHAVSLDDAEEDYLALLPYAGCFVLLLAFPGEAALRRLARVDQSSAAPWQSSMVRGYLGLLRRQRYCDPGGRQILSKNAAFGSWVKSLAEALPDARFVLCVREPMLALSSQISSVAGAAPLFGTRVESAAFQSVFCEVYAETLDHLAELLRDATLSRRLAVVDMDDLRHDPAGLIQHTLERLDVSPGQALVDHLQNLKPRHSSGHQHQPEGLALDLEATRDKLDPGYQAIINSQQRVTAP